VAGGRGDDGWIASAASGHRAFCCISPQTANLPPRLGGCASPGSRGSVRQGSARSGAPTPLAERRSTSPLLLWLDFARWGPGDVARASAPCHASMRHRSRAARCSVTPISTATWAYQPPHGGSGGDAGGTGSWARPGAIQRPLAAARVRDDGSAARVLRAIDSPTRLGTDRWWCSAATFGARASSRRMRRWRWRRSAGTDVEFAGLRLHYGRIPGPQDTISRVGRYGSTGCVSFTGAWSSCESPSRLRGWCGRFANCSPDLG